MPRKQVKVQADSSYIDRVDEVAEKLKEAGMTVQDEYPLLGHFRGLADADKVESLKEVPGVAVVSVIGDEGDEEKDDFSISTETE